MKKYLFLLITIPSLVSQLTYSQNRLDFPNISCRVDERAELMSIIFRLADVPEYVTNFVPVYTAEIDSIFSKFTEEPVVKMSQDMRRYFHVGYDAVMALAINLEIENGNVSLRNDVNPCEIDFRWSCDSINKYIMLLNDFYQKTEFHSFFEKHKNFYSAAVTNFQKNVLQTMKFDWYKNFYGEMPIGDFNIILSIPNGGNNYGPRVKTIAGTEYPFAIIGCGQTDSLGFPTYNSVTGELMIHEFNHSFCNPLIEKYLSDLLPKATIFNGLVTDKMRAQAYGPPETYLYELLVRACEIRYGVYNLGKANNENFWVKQEQYNGFLWMPELNDALTFYEQNRDKYPTLRSFMPEIVKVQNGLNPKRIYKQFVNNQPVIIGTNIKNGAQNVDPFIDKIIVKFDKPMFTKANGCSYGKKGKEYFIESSKAEWNEKSKKEWILYVKLQPNTEYSLSFPARFFFTEESYYNPKETYYLDFKTK